LQQKSRFPFNLITVLTAVELESEGDEIVPLERIEAHIPSHDGLPQPIRHHRIVVIVAVEVLDDLVLVRVIEPVLAVVTVLQRVQGDKLPCGAAPLRRQRVDDDARLEVDDYMLVKVHFARSPGELAVESGPPRLSGGREAAGGETAVR